MGGAGDDDQQVAARRRPSRGPCDRLGVVGLDRQHNGLATEFACLCGEHDRVGVGELAGAELGTDGTDLVARGQYGDDRPAPDEQFHHPGRGAGSDVGGSHTVPLVDEQLVGDDVLADRAHVLVGRHLAGHLCRATGELDVLTHDDRVEARWQRVPGVDNLIAARRDGDRAVLCRTCGFSGPERDAVHG